jgi:SAM-dependent methyltransferase
MAPIGLKVTRHDWSDTGNFIPLEETLAAAARAGLSVGDYIDGVMNNIPGATAATIEGMARLRVFLEPIETVVEIGPGSGRYLEKTVAACSPQRYEIYETSDAWAAYLAKTFDVIRRPTDGKTLRATPDASADLVHAHKVFSTIPFLRTCAYWTEMARVARPGGYVVFDIMSEGCLDEDFLDLATLQRWFDSGIENGSYPTVMPRGLAVDYFESRRFKLVGSFFVAMGPGKTEVLVFRKCSNAACRSGCCTQSHDVS